MIKKPDAIAVRLACLRIAARGSRDVRDILDRAMLLVGFVEGADQARVEALLAKLR